MARSSSTPPSGRAQQAETYRHPGPATSPHPAEPSPAGKGPPAGPAPSPPEAVDIQKDAAEDRGPLAGRQDFRPRSTQTAPTVPPQQAEVVIHAPAFPGRRVQQFLEKPANRRSHQSGKARPPRSSSARRGPLGQLAAAGCRQGTAVPPGSASRSAPGRSPVTRRSGLQPRPGIQQAGHSAVHHLIAGNGEGLPPAVAIGKEAEERKSYGLHGRQLLQRPLWPELGQAAALHLLRESPRSAAAAGFKKRHTRSTISRCRWSVSPPGRRGDGAVPEGLQTCPDALPQDAPPP